MALAEQCKDDLSREDVINLFDDRNFAALFINCCCCCRRRNRDAPLARWASTPSFLTGSLSTNNGASMENEREPATPTTTEQPRPTNFDSVPSIPSDLF